ncbi:3-hydroxyacyl-CoA dehydrogenase [Actinokineospora terrae]|uniref:3-hydroxybutyryl-CoA dehydrogenase n=1 Tax=Actinokineospora terrae TaxID=155974 RepID=A0A1H9XA66_9PSEU|nr:3-hydroxyacyl-CoA dehydrogenase [Actinokineospora terrae]SES42951.1 3-hydroxybutyryl-CoA dehydrogenase [Actinokineospora terrae]
MTIIGEFVDLAARATSSRTGTVAVLGAGAMGQGIAQLALAAGHRVLWHNRSADRLDRSGDTVRGRLERLVQKGKLTEAVYQDAVTALELTTDLAALADADLVIESIAEDFDVKTEVFTALEQVLREDAILATNTSSLSVNALSARLTHPGRFLGLHFFNPAPLLPLVEVVPSARTAPSTTDTALDVMRSWGRQPVLSRPTPGFIVNRVARPFYSEALRIVDETGADPRVVDAAITGSGGFRMGPLELTDLIGQDVNLEVTRQIWNAMGFDPRYSPSAAQQALVESGLLGRKTGQGFYRYPDDKPVVGTEVVSTPGQVRVRGDLGPAEPVVGLLEAAGWSVVREDGPGLLALPGGVVLALTDGRTAAVLEREWDAPVVVFDLALDFAAVEHTVIAAGPRARTAGLAQAQAVVAAFSRRVSVFADSPGLVVARTVGMLVNQAVEVVAEGVCAAADVEVAVRTGVNYPRGLLEWGDAVGPEWLCRVLDNIAAVIHPTRYRVTPSLRLAAAAGSSLSEAV